MYGSIIATGLLPALEGPYFARLLRFFPPVVTGTLLTIMGTTLLGGLHRGRELYRGSDGGRSRMQHGGRPFCGRPPVA